MKNKGQFQKGVSGNPKGRPQGSKSNFDRLIDKNSVKAYKLLTKAIDAGEPWAIKLFFEELVNTPDTLHLQIDKDNPDKIDAIITAVINAYSELEYISIPDACNILQSLALLQNSKQGFVLPKLS